MRERILVTGGAGYIGSILVPLLLNNDYHVKVFDNLMYNQTSLLQCFINPYFEFIYGDIRNKKQIKDAIKNVDYIIHLAAIVGAPACAKNPELAESINYMGAVNVEKARDKKTQKILFASTGSNYGKVKDICDEETLLNPLTEYGITKTKAEKHLYDSGNMIGFRFATAFGLSPRMRLDLLPNDFTYQAVKNRSLLVYEKNFRRTFIHVRDIARAFLHGINNYDSMKDQIYNCGSKTMNMTKEDLVKKIASMTPLSYSFSEFGHDPDQRDYEVSYKKIESTGYRITINIEEGIKELINGYKMIKINTTNTNFPR